MSLRKPSLTSQITHCPVPFHLDTYMGCTFGCHYCFARDLVVFARRNSDHPSFSYLVPNDHVAFERWLDKVMVTEEDDKKKPEDVALRERLVLKIGANSDPLPYAEKKHHVTQNVLRALHKYDYPTEIQTKNPRGLLAFADQFTNPNWTIAVTLISTDEKFVKCCEPTAPTVEDRLSAIKELTAMGLKVMVKIQPCIYPKILADLPDLVKAIKEAGCWAFNTEGLKLRIAMPTHEQEKIKHMQEYVGEDIREFYKKNRNLDNHSDYELCNELRLEYTNMAIQLAEQYGLRYFSADNGMGCIGCSDECCGTEVLRNYKLWRHNTRSFAFQATDKHAGKLDDCFCNFIRAVHSRDTQMTIKETVDDRLGTNIPIIEYEEDWWED